MSTSFTENVNKWLIFAQLRLMSATLFVRCSPGEPGLELFATCESSLPLIVLCALHLPPGAGEQTLCGTC
jgi:hypothetical protein